jgi:Plasmid pRiA4b ORF-3-like protein
MGELDTEDASRARLSALVPKEKFKFGYTYDFGDDWKHEVLVEKVLPPEMSRKDSLCVDGKRACPPEDVGGPWGYEEYLEAIRDPSHERHEELLEWGGGFDPEEFDLEGVNKQLRRLR